MVYDWCTTDVTKCKLKTMGIVLTLCLNIGVDQQDVVKPECWIDPTNLPPSISRAIKKIAGQLKNEYDSGIDESTNFVYKNLLNCDPDVVCSVC